MPAMLLKGLPQELHKALKQSAEIHHRSMNQEVIYILEKALSPYSLPEVQVFRIAEPMTADFTRTAIRKGRK